MSNGDKKLDSEPNDERRYSSGPIEQMLRLTACSFVKLKFNFQRESINIALFHFFNVNARIILDTPAKMKDSPIHAIMFATPKAGTSNIVSLLYESGLPYDLFPFDGIMSMNIYIVQADGKFLPIPCFPLLWLLVFTELLVQSDLLEHQQRRKVFLFWFICFIHKNADIHS